MLIKAIAVGVVALHKGMIFGGVQTQLNWYWQGKTHFTKTGYENHAASYKDKKFHDTGSHR